jgi:surfactin synthase thioesterase subunit
MHLFCFPFAGGNAYSYRRIEAYLPVSIRPIPVELPGHGRRASEPLQKNLMELVADAFVKLKDMLKGSYAFFGHSMGASMAHELARRIVREGLTPPRNLFLSGRQAPSVPEKHRRWDLPKKEFLEVLRSLGGCPPEVLESGELWELFEPILRADFEAIETHVPKLEAPIDVPISVFIGDRDEVTLEEARHWQKETTQEVAIVRFPGDHFFLFDHSQEIADLMALRLADWGID